MTDHRLACEDAAKTLWRRREDATKTPQRRRKDATKLPQRYCKDVMKMLRRRHQDCTKTLPRRYKEIIKTSSQQLCGQRLWGQCLLSQQLCSQQLWSSWWNDCIIPTNHSFLIKKSTWQVRQKMKMWFVSLVTSPLLNQHYLDILEKRSLASHFMVWDSMKWKRRRESKSQQI